MGTDGTGGSFQSLYNFKVQCNRENYKYVFFIFSFTLETVSLKPSSNLEKHPVFCWSLFMARNGREESDKISASVG